MTDYAILIINDITTKVIRQISQKQAPEIVKIQQNVFTFYKIGLQSYVSIGTYVMISAYIVHSS